MTRTDKDAIIESIELRQALLEQAKSESAELMAELASDMPPIDPEMNTRIYAAMERALRRRRIVSFGRKLYPALSKVAVVFLLLFLISALLVTQVSALRNLFYGWVMSMQEEHIELREEGESLKANEKSGKEQLIKETPTVYLQYLPEGLTLYFEETTDISRKLKYSDFQVAERQLNILILQKDSATQIDNRGLKEVKVQGMPAFQTENGGEISLVWSANEYLITVSSTLGESETLNIAEGLSLRFK